MSGLHVRHRRLLILSALVALGGASCERPRADEAQPVTPASGPTERVAPAASEAELRDAGSALAAYLDASREGSVSAAALDTLAGCGAERGGYLPSALLAAYTVLPPSGGGDTLVARAVVVTVAEQDADRRLAGRFVARQRVRADTLEWDLVRSGPGASWRVCNGLQFGYVGADSLTTWRPDGASLASARALADSIYSGWDR